MRDSYFDWGERKVIGRELVQTLINMLSVFLSMLFVLYMYMLQKEINKKDSFRQFHLYMRHKFKVLEIREMIIMLFGFLVFLYSYLIDNNRLRSYIIIVVSFIYA